MKQNSTCYYQAIHEEHHHLDIGKYHTYGIQAIILESIHDVSTDKATVEKMAEIFTKHNLSPIHLLDAIEDALL